MTTKNKEIDVCNNKESNDNLKIKNSTGYTRDVYCVKRKEYVYET